MKKTAEIISAIFNPLVLAVFITAGIIYQETGSLSYSSKWFIVATVFSILFAAFIVISIKRGIFSNFDVSKKKQRPRLFFAGTIAVLVATIFVWIIDGPNDLMKAMIVALLGLGTYQIIVPQIKASVHMGILTVFVSMLIFLFGWVATPTVLLIPIVAWARVKEKEHTIPEVSAGFLLGIIFSLLLIFLIQ